MFPIVVILIITTILFLYYIFIHIVQKHKKIYGLDMEIITEKYLLDLHSGVIFTASGVRYFLDSKIMGDFNLGDLVIISYVTTDSQIYQVLAIENIGPNDLPPEKELDNKDVQ